MGLTVHYHLSSRVKKSDRAIALVNKMRQLALDLPFEEVGEVQRYSQETHPDLLRSYEELRQKNSPLFGTVIETTKRIVLPWSRVEYRSGGYRCVRQREHEIRPIEVIQFDTLPSPGCETAAFGLCRYPTEVQVKYDPKEDRRFLKRYVGTGGRVDWMFDWRKWDQFSGHAMTSKHEATRTIKTGLGSWQFSSFCKTQYASDPEEGGIPNFLRGHISLITLLERIGDLPGCNVSYNDEGKYGRSYYTDDWTVKEPVYTWHDGKYSPAALVREVGSWNEMIAAFAGSMKDALSESGVTVAGSILNYENFEQLEFRGGQDPQVRPFVETMAKLVGQTS